MRITTASMSMALLLASALASAPKPAAAEIIYPWCAVYSERTVGATNCGFSTLAQCRATLSGLGGLCEPNPAYTGTLAKSRALRRHQPR